MFKVALASVAALFVASTAQAAEYKLGTLSFEQEESLEKVLVRPVTCLQSVRFEVPRNTKAVRIEKIRISYHVDGLGVDRETVAGRGFLREGESTAQIAVPQKGACVTAILVDGEGTWNPMGNDSRLTVYGSL